MIRLIITITFITSCIICSAQAGLKSRSINAAGGVKSTSSGHLTVINATSQSSSIKIHQSDRFMLRQGFIQPFRKVETFGMANISIYPNPTEGPVTIAVEGRKNELKITLYNLQGRTILSQSVLPNDRVDLSNLPKGLYHVVIKQYGSYLGTRKILIQ